MTSQDDANEVSMIGIYQEVATIKSDVRALGDKLTLYMDSTNQSCEANRTRCAKTFSDIWDEIDGLNAFKWKAIGVGIVIIPIYTAVTAAVVSVIIMKVAGL